MGNYKFRFSDMMPNAWFHKLKDMNKPRSNYSKTLNHAKKKHHYSASSPPLPLPPSPSAAASQSHHTSEFTPHLSDQRKSYYLTRDLTFQPDSDKKNLVAEPPRKSSRRRRRRSTKRNPPPRLVTSSSISAAACSCRATVNDSPPSPEESTNSGPGRSSSSEPDSVMTEYGSDWDRNRDCSPPGTWSSPCKCQAGNDIVIDVTGDDGDHRRLPPIITKKSEPTAKIRQRTSAEFSERNAYGSLSVKVVKEDFLTTTSAVRKFPAKSAATTTSPGVRLRLNSPRMRIQGRRSVSSGSSSASRRSISDSFAVVKASNDPGRDFKESMVEMIVENDMRASKDLEELLACYLSLNSDEYHDLIINVFKQIWFDFIHLRLK